MSFTGLASHACDAPSFQLAHACYNGSDIDLTLREMDDGDSADPTRKILMVPAVQPASGLAVKYGLLHSAGSLRLESGRWMTLFVV